MIYALSIAVTLWLTYVVAKAITPPEPSPDDIRGQVERNRDGRALRALRGQG